MNYVVIILKYIRPILITVVSFILIVILYKNLSNIFRFFKDKQTDIDVDTLPSDKDLNNPKYVIDKKIIETYVDNIIQAIDRYGTDEKALDLVYKHLKNSSKENTVNVWNSFKNRHLSYNHLTGHLFSSSLLGEEINLYQVLKSELTNSQSEKNALINWTWLLKKHGLI